MDDELEWTPSNDNECKFHIAWGRAGLGRSLSAEEIEALKNRLTKLADGKNIISANFLPAEVLWMENNVDNMKLQRITSDTADGSIWCIIGPDAETVKNYVDGI